MHNSSFCLVSKPWVPVVTPEGKRTELSLLETFQEAHELVEIHDESPLVTLALHRLLLAIVHRAVGGPKDLEHWQTVFGVKRFDAVGGYLEKWKHRFDLLHHERPFYQTRGLSKLGYEPDSLTKLIFERSNYGAPVLVFQHRPEDELARDRLSYAEAARALLAFHAFAPGGLVKKKGEPGSASAGPLNRGAFVLVRGRSLFETLMLNLLVYDGDLPVPRHASSADLPAWEQEALARPTGEKEPSRNPLGWIDQLSWQSRRVELTADENGVEGLIHCVGQKMELVGATPEPMLAYKKTKDDVVPVLLSEHRALFRDAHALLQSARQNEAGGRPPLAVEQVASTEALGEAPLLLDVLGMRGDQAKILLMRHERLSFPAALVRQPELQHELEMALRLAEDVALKLLFAVRRAVEDTLAPGGRKPDPADVRRTTESLAPERLFWADVAKGFDVLLDGIARGAAEATIDFERAIRRAAHESLRQTLEALGTSARQLQGGARAEAELRRDLDELMPERGEAL